MREWIVAQVDGLCVGFCLIGAPGFAPEPFLRQTENRNSWLSEIGKILVEISETGGVSRELLIEFPEDAADSSLSELVEIHDEECADMIGFAFEMIVPVSLVPESELRGEAVVAAERCEPVDFALQVHVPKFGDI